MTSPTFMSLKAPYVSLIINGSFSLNVIFDVLKRNLSFVKDVIKDILPDTKDRCRLFSF